MVHFELKKVTTLNAVLLIVAIGAICYFSGLTNQFVGDDYSQIVTSLPAHSISNIALFFRGDTFYNSGGLAPLASTYYRPLMITVYALVYTFFGPKVVAFHLVSLGFVIAGAIMVFLVLRYFFKPAMALVLALVFLVHPINSQNAFALASLQEPLFFLFGMLALWTLVRFQGKSLWYFGLSGAFLLLSLLSKETGILFVIISLAYLYMTDQKRRATYFLGVVAVIMSIYLYLKIMAVGLLVNPHEAPIDNLNLFHRLLNLPEILQFYFTKFLFPIQLSQYYFWAYKTVSFQHFFLPLLFDLIVAGVMVYAGYKVRHQSPKREFILFLFFSVWLVIGLLMHAQIVPLDGTVSESWFLFPMVGLLGMIGVVLEAFPLRWPRERIWITVICIVAILGVRTAIRGLDWKNNFVLASHDILVSKEDYVADNMIAEHYVQAQYPAEAERYGVTSMNIYPSASGYATLGAAYGEQGLYPQAAIEYLTGIRYFESPTLYEGAATMMLFEGTPKNNLIFLGQAVKIFPEDGKLWFAMAILDDKAGETGNAKRAIQIAQQYGVNVPYIYDNIMDGKPFSITLFPKS